MYLRKKNLKRKEKFSSHDYCTLCICIYYIIYMKKNIIKNQTANRRNPHLYIQMYKCDLSSQNRHNSEHK